MRWRGVSSLGATLVMVTSVNAVAADTPTPSAGPAVVALRLYERAQFDRRWADSPYPVLLATPWATALAEQGRSRPGFQRMLTALRIANTSQVRIGVQVGVPAGLVTAVAADAATRAAQRTALEIQGAQITSAVDAPIVTALLPLGDARLESLVRNRGPLPQGKPLRWSDLAPLSDGDLAQIDAPAAEPAPDAQVWWRTSDDAGKPVHGAHATWQVMPYGLREHVAIELGRAVSAQGTADRDQLTALPATAIVGLVTAPLPTLVETFPELLPASLRTKLTALGITDPSALLNDCGGVRLWAEGASPLPRLWAVASMPEATATAVLTMLDAQAGFVPGSDGVHLGTLGFLPVQAAYHDGALRITTDPSGPRRADPAPGFATAAATALAELPTEPALILGVSRSAEVWPVLAAITPLLARSRTDLATLGADLKAAARLGFLAVRVQDQRLLVDAGGLFGGPLASSALTGEFFRLVTTKPPVISDGAANTAGQRQPPAPAQDLQEF